MDLKNKQSLKKESPFRKYLVGMDTRIPLPSGRMVPYINFDNAATTPPLHSVMEAVNEFAPWYSSIHRGKGYKSQLSTRLYEESRNIIKEFVRADLNLQTVIYVKNTTEAINKVANRLAGNKTGNKADYVILSSEMEHHSNDLPWRNKFNCDFITLDSQGRLSLQDLEAKLISYRGRVILVTVTGASNVTGSLNPIHQIAGLAHRYGAEILVDGAQLVPHQPVDLRPPDDPEHLDHLVFSAHKMYAPFGIGVLISPFKLYHEGEPDYSGGGTVRVVTRDTVCWAAPPWKEEAGTPNLMGVVTLTAAITTLTALGIKEIAAYESMLTGYACQGMKKIPGVQLYNQEDDRAGKAPGGIGIIPFNIAGLSHDLVATILSREAGIAVRNGCFCAQPYIQKLLHISSEKIKKHIHSPELAHPGLVRLSFGMYNNITEIDTFLEKLAEIAANRGKYRQKYGV